jgi:hypothetical protein
MLSNFYLGHREKLLLECWTVRSTKAIPYFVEAWCFCRCWGLPTCYWNLPSTPTFKCCTKFQRTTRAQRSSPCCLPQRRYRKVCEFRKAPQESCGWDFTNSRWRICCVTEVHINSLKERWIAKRSTKKVRLNRRNRRPEGGSRRTWTHFCQKS